MRTEGMMIKRDHGAPDATKCARPSLEGRSVKPGLRTGAFCGPPARSRVGTRGKALLFRGLRYFSELSAFATAARNALRESGNDCPRGANRSRTRKKPVNRNASATAAPSGVGASTPGRRKAGSGSSLSRHGAPALALTARPDLGET